MRVLGLDIGSARIGVALSDAEMRVASPLVVLDTKALRGDIRPLKRLIEEWEVELIVVGLPLTLAGEEGPQAHDVRETAEALGAHVSVPMTYHDERLSSVEANRVMAEAGVGERERRGAVDKVAAAVFLQSYLDSADGQKTESEPSDE